MQIEEISKALSSKTRLRIIWILKDREMTSIEVFEEYRKKYSDIKNRETIYNALERLTEVKILKKEYEKEEKKLKYSIRAKIIVLDLIDNKIILKN